MREQELDFRKDEVNYVIKRWTAVESCSLIGVGSIGKSNFLQHLTNPQLHKKHLADSHHINVIVVDANLLGPLTDDEQFRCWAGYELMMHRLFLSFYPFDVLGNQAQQFYETYQQLQDGTNPLYAYMGLRYFELGLEFFFRQGIQLVFMFDECEEFLRQLPPRFFQSLRGLRDNHKKQLSYVTFTREPLMTLINKFQLTVEEMEPFVELFNDNEYFVGPYNYRDSQNMLDGLLKRHKSAMSESAKQQIIAITGGFAGILRATFQIIDRDQNLLNDPSTLLIKVVSRKAIRIECETIWDGLSPNEQSVLKIALGVEVRTLTEVDQEAINLLVFKRLLRVGANSTISVEPPIFSQFLSEKITK